MVPGTQLLSSSTRLGLCLLLVKKLILGDWSVEVVDIRLEDVILVKLERKETQSLLQFATFLAGSSWDIDPEGALMF